VTELDLHRDLAYGVLATAAIVFVSLFFVTAPYGRHTRAGWGPTLSSRLGWMIMESPSAIGFAIIYALGRHALEPVPLVLAALWLSHYVHRAYVFPLRMRSAQKPMPLSVAGMAIVFNLANAYLNARWVSDLGSYPTSWLADPRFVAGVITFVGGMAINIQSDNILFALRRPGEAGYKIPHGGAYRLVSSPNYFGELLEWGGWAVATWSLAGLAFFVFTFANLVPRALAHHRWYRQTFPEYPKERRAVIPWLV
jgi:protein-S-isoprenylcysteine O-methyltransferase Ste14